MRIDVSKIPQQAQFVSSTTRYSCYSGGFGAGKTVAGCVRAILLSTLPTFAGNVGLIGRLTYPELRDTTRKTFFELCPSEYYAEEKGGKFLANENYLRFINGSEIIFRHLDTISEKELLSLNLGWFYIDQAEEISESVFMVLQSRLRLNRVPNRFGFLTCNPDPSSWIYTKFKKPKDDGTLDADYEMIEGKTKDNIFLPKDTIESLYKEYPEDMIKRYLEGRWDVLEDKIYTEFDRDIHVLRPFQTPKGWEYLVSLDHGMVNPSAALLGAIDFDGNLYIIDEYYSPGIVSEHVASIKPMAENYEVSLWVIDPATAAKTMEKKDQYGTSMPWSIIEEYQDYGLFFAPGNNQKLAGINRVKEFLKPNPHRRHPITKEKNAPRLYIFQNCVNLLDELSQYKWKKYRGAVQRNKPEQTVDYKDHAVDSLRYMIMTRFPAPSVHPTGLEFVLPRERSNANIMARPVPRSAENGMFGMYEGGGSIISFDAEHEG